MTKVVMDKLFRFSYFIPVIKIPGFLSEYPDLEIGIILFLKI